MTDYILHKKNDREKTDTKKKSHKLIFLIFGLLISTFVIINIAGKSISAARAVSSSSWDGKSSFSVSLGKVVFVYQQDPKRAVFLSFDSNLSTNNSEVAKKFSRVIGAPVDYYLNVGNESFDNINNMENAWKSFTSYTTPIKIITGSGLGEMDTNISRIDAIKLWWQAKGIGANKLEVLDLGKSEMTGSDKVLGARSQDLNRFVGEYFENVNIISDKADIKIINMSGVQKAGYLASNFITSVGGNVANINSDTNNQSGCRILTSDINYTAGYLAKLFECDIKDAPEGENEGEISIFIGTDFSHKYF